jgi:hypothetical protein
MRKERPIDYRRTRIGLRTEQNERTYNRALSEIPDLIERKVDKVTDDYKPSTANPPATTRHWSNGEKRPASLH